MSRIKTAVTDYLDEKQVPYTVKTHQKPVFTSEDAARERGVRLSQIVKCMIGRDTKGALHIMLIPGDRILKIKRVRQLANGENIQLMPAEEIAAELGVTVGAISPLQFVGKARMYMDNTIFDETDVDISSGNPDAGVELKASDLCRELNAVRCDIISQKQTAGG